MKPRLAHMRALVLPGAYSSALHLPLDVPLENSATDIDNTGEGNRTRERSRYLRPITATDPPCASSQPNRESKRGNQCSAPLEPTPHPTPFRSSHGRRHYTHNQCRYSRRKPASCRLYLAVRASSAEMSATTPVSLSRAHTYGAHCHGTMGGFCRRISLPIVTFAECDHGYCTSRVCERTRLTWMYRGVLFV